MAFASNIPAVSVPTESEFKGFPVLTLPNPIDAGKPGVQLGVSKIRAVIANLDACKAFVAKHPGKARAAAVAPAAVNKLAETLRASGMTEAAIAAALKILG